MNLWGLANVTKIVLLLFCFCEQILAGSLVTDLIVLHVIKNLIKPRFVPLPVPLPLPIKFIKNTHKAYPVPIHGHSFDAHEIGHSPFPLGLSEGHHGLGHHHYLGQHASSSLSHNDFSEISHLISAGHEASHVLPTPSKALLAHSPHHDLPNLSQDELATIAQLLEKSELIHKQPSISKDLLKPLDHGYGGSSSNNLHILNDQDDSVELLHDYSTRNYLSHLGHSSDLLHGSSSLVGSIHDGLGTINNFGLFDHLHGLGGYDWW